MTDAEFGRLCNVYGFAPSRALREMLDKVAEMERESCAKVCDDAAIKLFCGKSRVNQVDRHTAEVLRRKADAIRARSNA